MDQDFPKKTEIPVNVARPASRPLPSSKIFSVTDENAENWETLFPRVSNQEMNASLKLIGEIFLIKSGVTFHLALHFATTVTL